MAALALSILAIIDIYIVAGKQVATADPRIFFDSSATVTAYNKNNEFRRMFTLGNVEFFLNSYNRSRGWEGDKFLYSLGTKLLPPELSAYYHIPTIGGYTQLFILVFLEFAQFLHPTIKIKQWIFIKGK